MLIPSEELERLEQTIRDAHRLALEEQVLGGYELLDLMLSWAENPARDLETGEAGPPDPWAEALCDRYRAALVAYAEAHGVSFAPPTPTPRALRERGEALRWRSQQLRERSSALVVSSQRLRQLSRTVRLAQSIRRSEGADTSMSTHHAGGDGSPSLT